MCKTVSVVFRGFLFLKNNTLNRKVHLSKLHWCGDVQEAYCACKLQTEDLAQTVTLCLALLNVNLIPFLLLPMCNTLSGRKRHVFGGLNMGWHRK